MDDLNYRINELSDKLENLISEQKRFINEIRLVKEELKQLQQASKVNDATFELNKSIDEDVKDNSILSEVSLSKPINDIKTVNTPVVEHVLSEVDSINVASKSNIKSKSNLERFIGENLISKIGILITIFGVAIGVKYAIDNDLISPLTRIIFGYFVGIGLFGFAIKLKTKYQNYSAVLLSGSMAIMYLVTFLAYSLYNFFPQIVAFLLMLIFTIFTVIAALNYNKQIIALIGLVGAYAVPFLLSEGNGQVVILFTYMAIINIGILVITFNKLWKLLYYTSFVITWIIFISWYGTNDSSTNNLNIASIFALLFFATFYAIFLAYKLIRSEKLNISDAILLLTNSFVFYGIGYNILTHKINGDEFLGLFTVFNAIIHFIFCVILYKKKLASTNLFYVLISLVILFITLAFPVQLNGYWVTLFWLIEGVLLFWFGRSKQIPVFEKISYALIVLVFFSLLEDWQNIVSYYPEQSYTKVLVLLNLNFLNSILFLVGYGIIYYLSTKLPSAIQNNNTFLNLFKIYIVSIFIIVLYLTFKREIDIYWTQLYLDSAISISNVDYFDTIYNTNLLDFKAIWIINYTLFFTSVLAIINIYKFKIRVFGIIDLILMLLSVAVFMLKGLYILSDLRENYLAQNVDNYFPAGISFIYIRYLSIAFLSLSVYAFYKYFKSDFMLIKSRLPFDFLFYSLLLWTLSSELINWMDIAHSTESYKLGLSILWGVFSLFLISFGIIKQKKYLRIWAIVLFGITLLKLFFYDMAYLNPFAKVIVLISLGVLLLIISFLYNKYKHLITNEN